MIKHITFLALLIISTLGTFAQPVNDNPFNATALTVTAPGATQLPKTGSNYYASNTFLQWGGYGYSQVPACSPSSTQQKDIWFKFNSGSFTNVRFNITETGGSPVYGHANLFRLFSTDNCNGVYQGGALTEVACWRGLLPTSTLASIVKNGITANKCYFLQMSCYISTGSVWSSFQISAQGSNAQFKASGTDIEAFTIEGDKIEGMNTIAWFTHEEDAGYEIIRKSNNTGHTEIISVYSLKDIENRNEIFFEDITAAGNEHYEYTVSRKMKNGTGSKSNTISIMGVAEKTNMKLFPNPASGSVQLVFNSASAQNIGIRIYDMYGRVVKSVSFDAKQGENAVNINLESICRGQYILQLIEMSDKTQMPPLKLTVMQE